MRWCAGSVPPSSATSPDARRAMSSVTARDALVRDGLGAQAQGVLHGLSRTRVWALLPPARRVHGRCRPGRGGTGSRTVLRKPHRRQWPVTRTRLGHDPTAQVGLGRPVAFRSPRRRPASGSHQPRSVRLHSARPASASAFRARLGTRLVWARLGSNQRPLACKAPLLLQSWLRPATMFVGWLLHDALAPASYLSSLHGWLHALVRWDVPACAGCPRWRPLFVVGRRQLRNRLRAGRCVLPPRTANRARAAAGPPTFRVRTFCTTVQVRPALRAARAASRGPGRGRPADGRLAASLPAPVGCSPPAARRRNEGKPRGRLMSGGAEAYG